MSEEFGHELSVGEALTLALRLHQAGALAKAEATYEAILTAFPGQPDALHYLGILRFQQHRADEAVKLIREALAAVPDYADAYNNLGNILKELGRRDEARQAYQRVIELLPEHADAHNNLGVLYRLDNALEAAMTAYQRAAELAPELPDAHFNLGNVYGKLSRHELAVASYREAIRLNPQHIFAYKQLGVTLYRLGRNQEAIDVYRDWLALSPDHPVALHMLAACSGEDVPERVSDTYVRDLFDEFASSFDEHLDYLDYQAPALLVEAVDAHLGEPQGALRILDAGCGTGLCGPLVRAYASQLVGVDLSAGMLARAREKGCYDELLEAELTGYLSTLKRAVDLIISADTLVYFGDLQPVMEAAAGALKPSGWLIFSVEHDASEERFRLDFSGRYCHSENYLRDTLQTAGLRAESLTPAQLRMEYGQPVTGLVVVARKP